MGIINRTARGLLSLLDSQTQGVVPSSLGEVIAPTLGMEPFLYGARGLEIVENATNVTAIGATSGITVPAGETWFVWGISCISVNLDALITTIRLAPAFRQTTAVEYFQFTPVSQGVTGAAGIYVSVSWATTWQPLILNQGGNIATFVQNIATGGGTGASVQTQAAIFRMQV